MDQTAEEKIFSEIVDWADYGGAIYGVLPNGDEVEMIEGGGVKVWKRGAVRQIPYFLSEKKRRDR